MPELVADAGLERQYADAIERAEDLYRTLAPDFAEQAIYAVALAHRIRYVMQCNAREAMHLIELRSGSQGHPAYRRVAQQMHRAIAERRRPPRLGRRHDLRRPRVDRPRTARIGATVRAAAGRKICNTLTRNNRHSPW